MKIKGSMMFKVLKNIFGAFDISDIQDKSALLKMYEPFKLTQRFLTVIIGLPYIILISIGVSMLYFGTNVENVRTALHILNESLGLSFTLILGFYFAGGMAEGIIERYKKPGIKIHEKEPSQNTDN